MYPKSKNQKLNFKVYNLLMDWLVSMLPENTELSNEEVFNNLPKEKYFYSMGQIRLNAYTHKWVRQRLKKVLRTKPIDSIMVVDLETIEVNSDENSLYKILSQGKVAIVFDADKFLGFITDHGRASYDGLDFPGGMYDGIRAKFTADDFNFSTA